MRAGKKQRVEEPSARSMNVNWPGGGGGGEGLSQLEFGAMAMSEEAQLAAEALEQPEYYNPVRMPSRKRERKRLGKPGPRSKCFLCSHGDERDTTLPYDDVNRMKEMIRQNTGRMETALLAEMVAEYFADFRRKINSQLNRGERPLAEMSASTVAEHIRRHHQDPEVKQIIMLETLQEAREELTDILFEKNNKTGHKRGNKVQIDNLIKIIDTELKVQSKDPSKMMGYAAGARVNPVIHRQGAVSTATKNLLDYWRNVQQS
jgi:hypothetical protein